MPNRRRNEDTSIQVFVNGERLIGTRGRVTNWRTRLLIDVETQAYTGEHFERGHEVYRGAEVEFTLHPIRPVWPTLVDFIRRRAIGETTGQVDIHVRGRFRSGEVEKAKIIDAKLSSPEQSGDGMDLVEESYNLRAEIVEIS